MKKSEFVAAFATKTNCSKKDAEIYVSNFIETIEDVLASGDKIQFLGFGSFETKVRAARDYRNPKTGEIKKTPATNVASFKVSKTLKEKINK